MHTFRSKDKKRYTRQQHLLTEYVYITKVQTTLDLLFMFLFGSEIQYITYIVVHTADAYGSSRGVILCIHIRYRQASSILHMHACR
jgi:hypothetical protein